RPTGQEALGTALEAVFDRQGGREAVAEREGVGQHVDVGRVVEAQRAHVAGRQIAVREERGHATSGEAAELHERLSDLRRGADFTGGAERRRRRTGDLVADVGPQETVSGRGAGIDVQTAASAEADGVERTTTEHAGGNRNLAGSGVEQVVSANTAANAEAG